jgi:uncharacterized protein (TIGR02186 family)
MRPRLRGRRLIPRLALALALSGLTGVAAILAFTVPGHAQALIADLSSHLIAITTGFSGTEVVLFGTTDGPGDVAVVVLGPRGRVVVRRKDRVGGLWINRATMAFKQVPGYYALATSRPLSGLAARPVLARHEIGLENLPLVPELGPAAAGEALSAFREALVRNKQRLGLYEARPAAVSFLGERLFRTTIPFPSNVPIGTYTVWVFLIRDGDVITAQATPLSVSKLGLSAEVFDFAQQRPALYGLAAVFGAGMIGWAAARLFGKS